MILYNWDHVLDLKPLLEGTCAAVSRKGCIYLKIMRYSADLLLNGFILSMGFMAFMTFMELMGLMTGNFFFSKPPPQTFKSFVQQSYSFKNRFGPRGEVQSTVLYCFQ